MASPDAESFPQLAEVKADYGSTVKASRSERSRRSTWAKEYAEPWMLLTNALGVVGYPIISMFMVAYQVLWRRHYIMACWHGHLPAWQLWVCEYTKAYTRFLPLVAILISLSLVRSMILIQRMYYELLHHGAILQFKEYRARQEPVFYVLTVCLLHAASNFALEVLTPSFNFDERKFELLEGARGWFVYLVIPIVTFICSLYFAHEPSYNLVPLSRFTHGDSLEDEEAAQEDLRTLIRIDEEHVQAICEHWAMEPCTTSSDTARVYQDIILAAKDFRESGAVIVGKQHLTKKLTHSQITDRFWPAKFLLDPALQDDASANFRRVSKLYDLCCVIAATYCIWLFIRCAYEDILDVNKGEVEDLAALLVEAAHLAFALFYVSRILRTGSIP